MNRRDFLLTPAVVTTANAAGNQAAKRAATAWATSRPRLYFNADAVASLRRRCRVDGEFGARWAKLLEQAGQMLNAQVVTEDVAEQGGGQHANYGAPSGQISNMGLTLGLAYHVTGERKYAEKLRQTMLAYAAYKRWYGQGLDDRVPPWRSELNTARFCFGFGAGYDAIHDFLPAADRKAIASGMVRLGILPTLEDWILPAKRIHALDSMGHNWWSVCVAMAGVSALALLGDDDRAPGWIDAIARGFDLWFDYRGNVLQNKPANFDSNGAFYESLGYTSYALSEYLRFRLAHANVFPGRTQPRYSALEKTTEFLLQTMYPASAGFWTPNIGDGSLHQSGAPTVRLLAETGFNHPAAGWYLKRTETGQPTRVDALTLLLRKQPLGGSPDTLATSAYYPDIGWATLRDSWEDNATFMALKCGMAWNHAHADAGSFILYHAGEPLIIESGTCSYSNSAYSGYYTQSRAHNVTLYNGKGEPEEDHRRATKFTGRLPVLLDGLGVKYVYADATGPMARYLCRNYRHWLWVGGAIVVVDDVLAYEPGRIDWLLHYQGSAEPNGNGVVLTNGAARAEVRFLYPAGLAVREDEGLADHEPARKTRYLVFSAQRGFRDQKFLAVILPFGPDGSRPEVSALLGSGAGDARIDAIPGASVEGQVSTSPDKLGLRIKHGEEVTEVYLNINADGRRMHVNSNNIIGGWDTDACLFAVTRAASVIEADPDNITRFFVGCGSYLRKNGKVALSCLSKVDAVWRPGETPRVVMHGQDLVDLELRVPGRTASAVINGETVRGRFDSQNRLAAFRVGPRGARLTSGYQSNFRPN